MLTHNDAANKVSIMINGRVHQDWESYEIDSDLMIPSDAWQVSIGLKDQQLPDFVSPWAHCQVKVGNNTVLTGRVDGIEDTVEKNQHSLMLTGRDQAAVLLDCAAPIFSASKVTLPEVVNKVVRPLGIHKVRIDAKHATNHKKINIEPGERAWSALRMAAEANGLWPYFTPDGILVIGGPDYSAPPVATIVMRNNGKGNNAISIRRTRQMAQQYSQVTVLGQTHGTEYSDGQHNIKATAKAKNVTDYRPEIVTDYEAESSALANKKARKTLTDSLLSGFDLVAKVAGHRTENGLLWEPGQRIQVLSEPHGINASFFLMGRKLLKSKQQGATTQLRLKQDKLWIPDGYPETTAHKDFLEAI